MDSISPNTPIIIDFGTSTIRVGFSGQDKPSLIFPNILGEINYPKAGGLLKKEEKSENESLMQNLNNELLKNISDIDKLFFELESYYEQLSCLELLFNNIEQKDRDHENHKSLFH